MPSGESAHEVELKDWSKDSAADDERMKNRFIFYCALL